MKLLMTSMNIEKPKRTRKSTEATEIDPEVPIA
jgi:hypothetical protein